MKEELQKLEETGWDAIREVANVIEKMTKNNPLVLFKKEQVLNEEGDVTDDHIDIYDLPYGYNVDKYSTYQQGAIMEVQGTNIKLFLTGDEFGQIMDSELGYIPFECQLQLLSHLMERE